VLTLQAYGNPFHPDKASAQVFRFTRKFAAAARRARGVIFSSLLFI
jgi:hypothetical protein